MTYEAADLTIDPTPGSPSWDVRRTADTTSTNADLLALARSGEPEGVVLVADHQTAGRGRLDRTWEAPPGASLLTSILLRPSDAPRSLALDQTHLVANAVGIAAAVAARRLSGVDVRLKWPNDLVIATADGVRKVSGILAESILSDGRVEALVVGIGINVNWPADLPPELADIAIALNHAAGAAPRPPRAAGRAAPRRPLLRLAGDGRRSEPRSLGEYRSLSATIGSRVRVELPGETFEGDAIDITAEGHLLVVDECPDRPREVVAGDVVHVRPAAP